MKNIIARMGVRLVCAASAVLLAAFSPAPVWLDPSAENDTPAFDAAVALVCAPSSQTRTIHFPAGDIEFVTPPQPMPCAVTLKGEGLGATQLIRRYSGGGFLHWVRGVDHRGGGLAALSVIAGSGTNGGIAVLVSATPDTDGTVNSYNRHSFVIDNVLVGRESPADTSWDFGLYLDGSKNPDGNADSVPGIRDVTVSRSTFGGTNTASVYLNRARGTDLHIECYTPLNGSFVGVVLDNGTDSVRLQTRGNCGYRSNDGTGRNLQYNGQYVAIP
ncbi:MAG TPA: hypothetical protein PK405_02300 [Hyphomicrobiales bacterium]|nr:hypothetical protein [Rhodobiaceae bacterium]HXK53494.1 hypothetical protein [Hyphomicrobiales bacterium]